MSKMLLKILQILPFLELWCAKCIFFWFYRSAGFEGNIRFAKKKQIALAVECADETVLTFTMQQMRVMVQ